MESGSYLVFIVTMGLLYVGVIVFVAQFLKSLFRRDVDRIVRLCLIGLVWLGTHLVWTFAMPSGSHTRDQFSGFTAFMHYVYFIVMCWVLSAMNKLSRAQPTPPLQKDAPKDGAPLS